MGEQTASDAARALGGFRRRETKVCSRCGTEFVGYSHQKYCCHDCAVAAYWDAHRADLNQARRQRYRDQKGDPQQTS